MKDRMLCVDDDEFALDMRIGLLSKEGLTVLKASTKEEALAAIEDHAEKLAVVVTDLQLERRPLSMPSDSSGNEVAEAALCKGIKVIVVSSDPRLLREDISARCVDVIQLGAPGYNSTIRIRESVRRALGMRISQ